MISLKYCQLFNLRVLEQINNSCNSFFLSELYLDGCENVNDDLFNCIQLSKEEKSLDTHYETFFKNKNIEEQK